jgi:hypothetical protein
MKYASFGVIVAVTMQAAPPVFWNLTPYVTVSYHQTALIDTPS